ncbi:MAG: outer membrane protein transport protein [Ignavibacteriales bacterium]|nr:outer membrane protein transport protein [Ignavibacteriales bacterium]
MRKLSFHVIGTIVLSVLIVCIALGGGYQLNEQGARAVGMGGAFVARASDPSAIYFNPAGMTSLKGINVLGGFNLIMPSSTFKGVGVMQPVEASAKSQVFTPINVYGTYQANDRVTVGLGIYNPYGLGTEWDNLWGPALNGAYLGSMKSVKADIATWYFNPSFALKINDQLSVGWGVSYVYATVTLTKNPLGIPTSLMEMTGTGKGWNANFGATYKPMDKLSIGLSYRASTNIEFTGDLKFSGMNVHIPGLPATYTYALLFPGGTGKATLPLPANLQVGAAYEIMPELTVEGDFQFVQWSAYKQLSIAITPPVIIPLPPPYPTLVGQGTITQDKNWDDGFLLRAGAEYKYNADITLRGGLILDLTPQPASKTEPMLPDADRTDITLGGSYKINDNLSVDASYMLVLFAEKNAASSNPTGSSSSSIGGVPGVYNSTAHIFSVNVGYAF